MGTHDRTQRDLLFGLLALQNNFISREELLAATRVWLEDKSQALAETLLDCGALSPDDHQLLGALVKRHLERHGGDPEASLTALGSASQELQTKIVALGDADVPTWVPPVGAGGLEEGSDGGAVANPGGLSNHNVRFRIIRPHAKGGLGEVYIARDEELNREVALKEIQARYADDPESHARFLLEAEITGGLEHPGIVPVYGLGQYPDGRPFYAMRFIRGDSLREAVARFRADNPGHDRFTTLEFRKLLSRFIDVCHALEYAHVRGVLHRDIKPANIMLGKYGETLLVDWGLAKPADQPEPKRPHEESLLQPRSGSSPVRTQMGSTIGTPAYMSPEQAEGKLDALGPASDVYSLGATLHYLLTGKPPVEGFHMGELLRRVQQGRITAPRDLDPGVPKALDAICRKAMALRPGDRYGSARELGEEIERYLADEPIQALREPFLVRLRRWARKHPAVVASSCAAAVVLVLALGTIASLQASHRQRIASKNAELALSNEKLRQANSAEKKARQEAERQAKIAQAVNDFLQNDVIRQTDMFAQAGNQQEIDPNLTLREALDRAAERIGDRFQEEPLVEAAIRLAIGDAYLGIGEAKKAIPHLEHCAQIRTELLGRDGVETLAAQNTLANAYRFSGRLGEAIGLLERILELRKTTLGNDHPDTLSSMNDLGGAYYVAGRLDEATNLLEQTLKLRKTKLGNDHPHTLSTMNNLAVAYKDNGQLDKAISLLKETLRLRRTVLRPSHPQTLTSMRNLADTYREAGRLNEAIHILEETQKLEKTYLGLEHPNTLMTMNSLAHAYLDAGRPNQAVPLSEDTVKLSKAILGPEHPRTLAAMNTLARAYRAVGRLEEAISIFEQALQARRARLGPDHPSTLTSMNNLAVAYHETGRRNEAIRILEEILKIRKTKFGLEHPTTLNSMNNLAGTLLAAGRLEDAVSILEETLKGMQATLGRDHPSTLVCANNLANAYYDARRPDEAIRILEETLKLQRKKFGPEHPTTLVIMNNLATTYCNAGKTARAAQLYKAWMAIHRKNLPAESPQLASLLAATGANLIKCKSYQDAEEILRECYELGRTLDPEDWTTYNAQAMLGAALVGQAETILKADKPDKERAEALLTEAEKLLAAGYHGLVKTEQTIPKEGRGSIAEAKKRLVWLYTVWGKPEQAAKWQQEPSSKP